MWSLAFYTMGHCVISAGTLVHRFCSTETCDTVNGFAERACAPCRVSPSPMPKVYTDMGQLSILRRTLPSQPKVSYQYWCLQIGCSISMGTNVAFSVSLSFYPCLYVCWYFAKRVLKLLRVCLPWYCLRVVYQSRYIYTNALSVSLFTCKVAHFMNPAFYPWIMAIFSHD